MKKIFNGTEKIPTLLITLALDDAVRSVKKVDWRGNRFKEREVRNAIRSVLGDDDSLVNTFFEIVKARHDY